MEDLSWSLVSSNLRPAICTGAGDGDLGKVPDSHGCTAPSQVHRSVAR